MMIEGMLFVVFVDSTTASTLYTFSSFLGLPSLLVVCLRNALLADRQEN